MDNKIFCLETEWEQSVYDLTHDTQAKPLLEFLKSSNNIDFIYIYMIFYKALANMIIKAGKFKSAGWVTRLET